MVFPEFPSIGSYIKGWVFFFNLQETEAYCNPISKNPT